MIKFCANCTTCVVATDIIEKKMKARDLKEKGNIAFKKKKFEEAERCYSEAIQLNIGYRPFLTNRASCRNLMKKYQEAISDCNSALSIYPKCTKSITQKGNALLGLLIIFWENFLTFRQRIFNMNRLICYLDYVYLASHQL